MVFFQSCRDMRTDLGFRVSNLAECICEAFLWRAVNPNLVGLDILQRLSHKFETLILVTYIQ